MQFIKTQLRQRVQKWPQNLKRGCLVCPLPPLFRHLDNHLLILTCDVKFSLGGEGKKPTTATLSHINKRSCFPKQFPKFNRGIKQEFNNLRFNRHRSLLSLQKLQETEILKTLAVYKRCVGGSMKAESRRLTKEESSSSGQGEEREMLNVHLISCL